MKVGDKVVCVSVNPLWKQHKRVCPQHPYKWQSLTIRSIDMFKGEPILRFNELVNPKTKFRDAGFIEVAFAAERFAPIDTRPELSELTDEMILTAPTVKELQTA